jgi:hypothetical protein
LVSNPYGTIGKELDVDATVKSLDDSEGLRLEFWTDTPSGKYEELAEINTRIVISSLLPTIRLGISS